MSLSKFESMLKTNNVYFFDLVEFEEIIVHYLDVGKHSLARKAVKLGLEQHPTSVDLKLLQVELLIFENKLEEASHLVKRLEILSPKNEEVYIQKATIFSKSGAHSEAIKNLKKSLIIVVPHTSWHDFYVGVFTRKLSGTQINFVAKKERKRNENV